MKKTADSRNVFGLEVVRTCICGLNDMAESKVIPRQQTCGTGESMEPLTVTDLVKGMRER